MHLSGKKIYEDAISAEAIGRKLLGAGGGGIFYSLLSLKNKTMLEKNYQNFNVLILTFLMKVHKYLIFKY